MNQPNPGRTLAVAILLVAAIAWPAPTPAEKAPGFNAETLEHTDLSLDDLAGKVVLLQFWASWCKTCIAGVPVLKALYEQHAERGFEIVGLSLDENIKDARRAVAEQRMPWPQICDGLGKDSPVAQRYGVQGTPRYILIDRTGALRVPYARAGELEQQLLALLGDD